MKTPVLRSLPLVLALALPGGFTLAQTSGSTATTPSTGSSVTGGGTAPSAQPGTGTRNTPKADKLARGDRKFIQNAAEDGMFEVQAGQLAATKATDADVKNYANLLVEQHTAANNELTQLANSKGLELPAATSRGDRRELSKLGKLTGDKFDDEFVKTVMKDHQKDIKDFQKASGKVKDADLKAWIDKTLPALRDHLAKAEALPEAGGKNAAAMGNRGAKSGMGTSGSTSGTGTTK